MPLSLEFIINEYFVFAFCFKLYSLSKSSWAKILRYYQHFSVPKILAGKSCKNFGVFLFYTMRQTHPELKGTIREKKNLVNNLTKLVLWKKADEKVLKEIDPANGPYTQCKNGLQFQYSFCTLKRAWLTMFSLFKFKRMYYLKRGYSGWF